MKINRSIPRIMTEKPGVYAGMIALTFLSVAMFVLLMLVAQNMYVTTTSYVRENVQEDLEFISTNRIDNIPGIEESFALTIEGVPMTEYTLGNKTLRLFAPAEKVNIPAVIEGRTPKQGEIALDPSFCKANGYAIGDTVTLDKQYTVSGIITLPNYAYILQKQGDFVNDPEVFGLGLLSAADMPKDVYLYGVKYDETQDNIYEQAKPLKAYLSEQGISIVSWEYAKYNMKISLLEIEVTAIVICSVLIPTAFMVITALLIAVVQNRIIKQQSRIIGTLYAQGYRKKELIAHYLCYPVIIVLIGGLPGGLAGMLLLQPGLSMMQRFFQLPVRHVSYNPLYLLTGTVLCCLIFCLGSYFSLNKIFRSMPSKLIRNGVKEKKINILERKLKINGLPFATKFAVREQLRSIPRLIFLVMGVIVASVFIIYGLSGESSFKAMLDPPPGETFHHQVEYAAALPQTDPVPGDGEPISAWNMVPRNNFSDRFSLAGINEDTTLITLKDTAGDPLHVRDDMVVISSAMAKRYGLSPGDTLSFVDVVNDGEYDLVLTDVAAIEKGDFVFIHIDNFNRLMDWEKGSYNAILSKEPLPVDETVFKIKQFGKMTSDMKKYTALLRMFVYGICAVAFVLGIIILYIITSVSIDENKDTISLMKIFGYKGKEVSAMTLNSSWVFVVIGYFIGAPMGFLIVKLLFIFLEFWDISIPATITPAYFLIGFVVIMLSFHASKQLSTRKINQVKHRDGSFVSL